MWAYCCADIYVFVYIQPVVIIISCCSGAHAASFVRHYIKSDLDVCHLSPPSGRDPKLHTVQQ